MTKVQHGMYQRYINSNMVTLNQAYGSFSNKKKEAYDYCMKKCVEMNGRIPRITSVNTYGFCFAFLYDINGKTMLHYETPAHTYDFEVK